METLAKWKTTYSLMQYSGIIGGTIANSYDIIPLIELMEPVPLDKAGAARKSGAVLYLSASIRKTRCFGS